MNRTNDDPRETVESTDRTEREATACRRDVLRSVAAAGCVLGVPGAASATGAPGRRDGGFPPSGITEWGPERTLGEGSVRTFTTVTPSGRPKYHGAEIERAALRGLPSPGELERRAEAGDPGDKYGDEGLAAVIHGKWSLEHFVPLPETDATPFAFLGLNWNPGGHPPESVYTAPHFDFHFHVLPPAAVDDIEGPSPSPFDVPQRRIPDEYVRPPDPALGEPVVVTDMGEHLVNETAPELNGGEFENTLIWGSYDADGDGLGEFAFVEPMVTREYLRGLDGVDRRPIPQPDSYAEGGRYPTRYSVRPVPSRDAVVVAIGAFRCVDGGSERE